MFAELAPEDEVEGHDMIGDLNYSMYGTRGAAPNLGERCADTMAELRFYRGKAPPRTFYHKARNLRTYIQ